MIVLNLVRFYYIKIQILLTFAKLNSIFVAIRFFDFKVTFIFFQVHFDIIIALL